MKNNEKTFLILAAIIIVLIGRIINFYYPTTADASLFLYFGRQLHNGNVIYQDLWDIKPPGIFYINYLYTFFIDNYIIHSIVEFVIILSGFYPIYKIMEKRYNYDTAIYSILIYSIFCSNYSFVEGVNMTEVYAMIFSLWAVYFIWIDSNKSIVIAGFFIFLATFFKLNGISVLLCFYIYVLISLIRYKNYNLFFKALIITGSFLFFWYCIYIFIGTENFHELINAAFIYPFSYASNSLTTINDIIVTLIARMKTLALLIPMYFLLVYLGAKYILEKNKNKFDIFLIGWVLSTFLGVVAGGRMYGHYFMLMSASFAIGCAMIYQLFLSSNKKIGTFFKYTSLILVCIPTVYYLFRVPIGSYLDSNSNYTVSVNEVIDYIDDNKNKGDLLWVQSYTPYIYDKTNLMSASRYTTSVNFYDGGRLNENMLFTVINDIDNKKPRWIVRPKKSNSEIDNELKNVINNYKLSYSNEIFKVFELI